MAKQLLFYESVIPVSLARHRALSIDRADYGFAREVNSVPLTAVEIPAAAREYTIVFAGSEEAVTPVVVLGVEGNENLYVNPEGGWAADYVPAFVRRYPFVFSRSDDGKQFTLCIDESWAGCNQQGKGQRLFDDQDQRTPYLTNLLTFLEQYQTQFQRTQAYCAKLKELDLLEPMKAEFTLPGGDKRSLTGFLAVSRDKLKALPAEKLSDLAKTDELELTYNHLLSLNNFSLMANRVAQRRNTPSAEADSSADKPAANTADGSPTKSQAKSAPKARKPKPEKSAAV